MRALVITSFDTFNQRISIVERVLEKKNIEFDTLTSNFSHIHKMKINEYDNRVLLNTLPYKKNISIRRIVSHRLFAKSVEKYIAQTYYDFLYVIIPPNSLLKPLIKLKKRGKINKVIIDVQDLWPESFPIKHALLKYLFSPIIKKRNYWLKKSDFVITECDLYKQHLKVHNQIVSSQTIYLAKNNTEIRITKHIDNIDVINFLYLGSINNIIDINFITRFLSRISMKKKCKLLIVGDGENRDKFINMLEYNHINFEFFGYVFEQNELNKIFLRSHFGINIYKSHLKIGLTMKSIDYFYQSLPIINNIAGDTWDIISRNHCGYNVTEENIDNILIGLENMTLVEYNTMSQNSYNTYTDNFHMEKILDQFSAIIDEVTHEK